MPSKLQEIAERLDISKATVSRALNGKDGVSPEMRQRVLEIAAELRITTSSEVQGLAKEHAFAVAYVLRALNIPMAQDDFYYRIMQGAELELAQHGYHLVSITIDENEHHEKRFPRNLDPRRLDGLIIAGPELSEATMTHLLRLGIPIVLAANRHPFVALDAVTSANREGAYELLMHLIEHGHQHIVCLSGSRTWLPVGDRVDGYIQAMVQHRLEPVIVERPGYLTVEAGYDAMQEILHRGLPVSAVFAANDPMAIGAMRAIQGAGLRIPDDIALAGFDNIVWSSNTTPPLTTVNIHKEEIGLLAARRLLDLLHASAPLIPIEIRVRNELVVRQSCCRSAVTHAATETSDYQPGFRD